MAIKRAFIAACDFVPACRVSDDAVNHLAYVVVRKRGFQMLDNMVK